MTDKKHIGSEAFPFVGLDAGDPNTDEPMRVLGWSTTSDIMTYCRSEWVSAHNYLEICERLAAENGSHCFSTSPVPVAENRSPGRDSGSALIERTQAAGVDRNGQTPPTSLLSITGPINLDANTATIAHVNRIDTAVPPAAARAADSPVIRSYDAQGRVLAETTANVSISSDAGEDEPRFGVISGEIPYSPDIAKIEIERNGQVIAQRLATAQKPVIPNPTVQMPTLQDYLKGFPRVDSPTDRSRGFTTQGTNLIYSWMPANPNGSER